MTSLPHVMKYSPLIDKVSAILVLNSVWIYDRRKLLVCLCHWVTERLLAGRDTKQHATGNVRRDVDVSQQRKKRTKFDAEPFKPYRSRDAPPV